MIKITVILLCLTNTCGIGISVEFATLSIHYASKGPVIKTPNIFLASRAFLNNLINHYVDSNKELARIKVIISHTYVSVTTMRPMVGMTEYNDGRVISLADLPGLIEGAHVNCGLGHHFLRHVERSKMLLVVVDIGGFQLSHKYRYRSCIETILLLNRVQCSLLINFSFRGFLKSVKTGKGNSGKVGGVRGPQNGSFMMKRKQPYRAWLYGVMKINISYFG